MKINKENKEKKRVPYGYRFVKEFTAIYEKDLAEKRKKMGLPPKPEFVETNEAIKEHNRKTEKYMKK